MPWILLEFIWRRKYFGDLYGGMMKSLREVDFVPGDRQQSLHTDYGNVETETENHEDEVTDSSNDSSSDDDNSDIEGDSDGDYRPEPPSNSIRRIVINREVGTSTIGPEDMVGDIRVQQNEEETQRRRLNNEVVLPFGVVRRSRRITMMSLL